MLIASFFIIKNILKKIRKQLILRRIDRIQHIAFKVSMHCVLRGHPKALVFKD